MFEAKIMVSGPLLSTYQGESFNDTHMYRNVVGAL